MDEVVKGKKRIRNRNKLPVLKSGNKGALRINPCLPADMLSPLACAFN
jgi:hypothetical protein